MVHMMAIICIFATVMALSSDDDYDDDYNHSGWDSYVQ